MLFKKDMTLSSTKLKTQFISFTFLNDLISEIKKAPIIDINSSELCIY